MCVFYIILFIIELSILEFVGGVVLVVAYFFCYLNFFFQTCKNIPVHTYVRTYVRKCNFKSPIRVHGTFSSSVYIYNLFFI